MGVNTRRKRIFRLPFVVAMSLCILATGGAAPGTTVSREDIDSGLAGPSDNCRWLDEADQLYGEEQRNTWNSTRTEAQFTVTGGSSAPGFVDTNGMQFEIDDEPYLFVGANFWYGLNLAANGPGGDRERLHRELDHFQSLGIGNLRIMAGSEGPNTEPWRMVPALQTEPGVYDPVVQDGLDYLLYAMSERGLRAVMCLTNFWPWSGGMAQYVKWNGGGEIPYPPPQPGGNWGVYQAYTSGFYVNQSAIEDYLDHIACLINRVNPYTSLAYRDDPTIMAWELANEPRGNIHASDFDDWIDDTAAFIKALDPNHLVTTGCEGDTPWPSANGLDFISNHDGPNIDYVTVHIWPENWGWYDPSFPGQTYASAEENALTYLGDHISDATSLNKPLVLEEFGLARDGGSYDPQSTVVWRDTFFEAMYEQVYQSARSGGPAVGSCFWAWAGEGRPLSSYGSYWSVGDPWIGDPPHERQGWYSVYDSDSTTLAVLSDHISEMNHLATNAPPVADDQSVTTDEDTAVAIHLTATDPDDDTLTYEIDTPPSNGTLTGDPPDLIYTPDLNFNGSDNFTFKANDGLSDSNLATVSISVTAVNDPPTASFTADPVSGVVPLTVDFDASGSSDPEEGILFYDWDLGDGGIDTVVDLSHQYLSAEQFTVTLTVTDDGDLSDIATVSITVSEDAIAPSITVHPADESVMEGEAATFHVVAEGSEPLSYQWQKDGVAIEGETGATCTTLEATLADDGAQFDVVVSNVYGSVTSEVATLTVNAAPGPRGACSAQ